MKKLVKRTAAAVMALALAVSLAACGGGGGVSAFDATKYIQGVLDENYMGKFDPDYMDMVEITENEAEETYLGSLQAEADYFCGVFDIEAPTDETMDRIIDLYKEIYANSKYTVDPATKIDDDTYGVKVTVEPIDIFHTINADFETYMTPFRDKYADVDINAMTEEEYAAYDAEWAGQVLDLCESKLPELGHLDAKSQVVQVAKGEDGYWSIPDEDFQNLDWLIIDYNF